MFSRRTSARTRKSRERMLHLKVSSPRIVFFDLVKFLARFTKLGIAILVMVGVGIGLGYGWQKLFVENEDFLVNDIRIKRLDGSDKKYLSLERIVAKGGIDLEKRETIFAIDTDELKELIEGLPEIRSAKVSRRLPGILKIEVDEREPVAWVACRSLGIKELDRELGLLVDETGVAFKCDSKELWEAAKDLPVIMVHQAEAGEIVAGEAIGHEGLDFAFQLVKLANEKLEGVDRPVWVVVKDEIMLEMKTRDGVLATFSYYGQERQMEDFIKLNSHARRQAKDLAKVNLIPRRFIPVHYR